MQNDDRASEISDRPTQVRRATALLISGTVAWVLLTIAEATQLREAGLRTWVSLGGVLGPVVVAATVGVGLVTWFLEPRAPWGVPRLRRELGRDPALVRRLALAFAFTCWVSLLATLAFGAVGLWGLVREGDWRRSALVLALAVLGVGVAGAIGVRRGLRLMDGRASLPVSIGMAALACVVTVVLVATGETSGAGGIAGMWGVFRREELTLTLPLYVVLIVGLGYQFPWFALRLPWWCGAVALLGVMSCFAWSFGIGSDVALTIEREAPLGRLALKTYQTRFDTDGDGFARRFGGGDCDDTSVDINPDAIDVPGNAVDEDCSGHDATMPVALGEQKPPADAVPTPQADAKAKTTDFNVVLITVDTLRFDLGFTGYQRPISPNIDALAKRSTVYDKAYSLASYTSKSLAPMMIGRYGSETNRGWMHFNKYPPEDRMVQERLKAHGIYTISVQGHWYFKADSGLGRGFDVLDMSAAPTRPQGEGDRTVNSAQLSDAAISLLRQPERSSQRFFMWVHYLDPHAEYVPHAEFDFGSKGRERYDGEIAFTDFHIGRVLAALDQSPLKERTVVILTSDHGEAFGEHGLIRHGFELWEELVRVPLLVYVPGQAPRHIAERRSAIDLAATLLEVYGVPTPSGDDSLSGQSMLGEWLGGTPAPRDVFVDMPAGPYNGDRQAFISNDVKLITSNSRPVGLYNLATDPGETNNLIKETALAEQSLEQMKNFRSKLRVVKVKPQ